MCPSKPKVQRICREISELTAGRWSLLAEDEVVGRLNQKIGGWANYFSLGAVGKAYRSVDSHANRRLRQWLCKKHKVRGRGRPRFSDKHLYQELKLTKLGERKHKLLWANA